MQGSGVTRISTFLTNPVASHVFKEMMCAYQSGRTFDHVPINMTLSLEKFEDYINVAFLPADLNLTSLSGMTMAEGGNINEERTRRYKQVWTWFSDQSRNATEQEDLESAHRIWCLAAETFLWELQGINKPLPNSKPRR